MTRYHQQYTLFFAVALLAGSLGFSAGAQTATVFFSGHTWLVRTWGQNEDPGPNYWATNGVWVDAQSNLHLRIHTQNGTNYCAEVVSTNTFGYGRYVWYVSNRVDQLASNVVAGLFTYAPPWGDNEIDIEFTRAFDASGTNNLVYTVQPYFAPNHQRKFAVALTNGPTTHSFTWLPGRIVWKSWHGWSPAPSNDQSVIAEYAYVGADVPTSGAERVHMNLWLFEGEPPGTGTVEMVVGRFFFESVDAALFADDFASPAMDPQWVVTGVDHPGGIVQSGGSVQFEPSNDDYMLLGYRTAQGINPALHEGPYEFSASLRSFQPLNISTQLWAVGGQSVQAVMALISQPLYYDPWNSENAIAIRATYTTNDNVWIQLSSKTNQLWSWGTVLYEGQLSQVSQYDDATGITIRLILDATNYVLDFVRGTNVVPLLYTSGTNAGPHQLGSSLSVSSYFVIAAANVADGRGRVVWENATGRVYAPPPSPAPAPDQPGPDEVQIFDPAFTDVWRPPFDTSRNKARCMALYRADEIGRDGLLTALAVRVVSSPGIPLSNFTIRLQHTTASSVPAWLSSGWTTGYVGHVHALSNGWHYFVLQTPFAYDGVRNLLVDFSFNNTRREQTPLGFARKVIKSGARTRIGTANSGDPLTWTSPAGTTTSAVPAIRFVLMDTNAPTQLLQNPGFEYGPAGEDNVPDDWWVYGDAARFSWAGYQGLSYGMAFKNWWPGAYGGFGQDVPVAAQPGDAFLFTIHAARDSYFASATSNVWLRIDALNAGGQTNASAIRPIYQSLMDLPVDTWAMFSVGYTNTFTNTVTIRVSVHFADGTDDTNGYRAVKWDNASLLKWHVTTWQANSAYGVPLWWLTQHGILPAHLTAADVEGLDHDNDGLATWQEYIAGTDPTNSTSRFSATHVATVPAANATVIQWPSVSNRLYSVEAASSVHGPYSNVSGTIAGTPPVNVFTNPASPATTRFYRLRVWLP